MKQKSPDTFVKRLATGIKHAGIENHHSAVCAVSGGTDSTALLLGLQELRENSFHLTAAHYNHRARGEESDSDEMFVRELCANHEIPLFVGHAESISKNLDENSARRARYEFLVEVAEKVEANTIAVAHTVEDQAETILMRIVRGTGSRGASGMKPQRPIANSKRHGLTVTRPMLRISRQLATEFLESKGIVARHDSSNDDWGRYARNRIRHRVFPQLEVLNPQAMAAINRFGEIQSSQTELIDQLACQVIQRASTDVANVIFREHVASSHRVVAAEVLSRMFRAIAYNETQLGQLHIDKLLDLISTGKSAEYHLPDNITFWTDHTYLGFSREHAIQDEMAPYPQPISRPIRLGLQSQTDLGDGYTMTSEIAKVPTSYESDNPSEAWLNPAAISDDYVVIRNRKRADTFQPLGIKGNANLADFLINAKIAASWRDRIPIVVRANDDRIAWLPGIRIAEWARVPDNATHALRLRFFRIT